MQTQIHHSRSTLEGTRPPAFLVLLFAPRWSEAEPVLRAIEEAGFDCIAAHIVEEGLDLMITERFDAVVATCSDVQLCLGFLAQARTTSPETHRFLAVRQGAIEVESSFSSQVVTTTCDSARPQELIAALRRMLTFQVSSRRKFVFDRRLHR